MKKISIVLVSSLLICLTSCTEVVKGYEEGQKIKETESIETTLLGIYTGVATYHYLYSSVNSEVSDQTVQEQRLIQIVKNGSVTCILYQNQSIQLSALRAMGNGIAFNIIPQVISTTDGSNTIQINGVSEILCTDGTKADGGYDQTQNRLTYSYAGNQPMKDNNGETILVPYSVSYEMKKN